MRFNNVHESLLTWLESLRRHSIFKVDVFASNVFKAHSGVIECLVSDVFSDLEA